MSEIHDDLTHVNYKANEFTNESEGHIVPLMQRVIKSIGKESHALRKFFRLAREVRFPQPNLAFVLRHGGMCCNIRQITFSHDVDWGFSG